MARDAKLNFTFVQNGGTVGSGIGVVQNPTNTATTAFASSFLSAPSGVAATGVIRATSQALNRSGFRTQTADQSQLATTNSVVSAITNDPAVYGNTERSDLYCRIIYGYAFPATAQGNYYIVVEAASDSGTGTAGTDWTPISHAVAITPVSTVTGGNTNIASGVATSTTAHGLSVGQVVVPVAGTFSGGAAVGQPLYVVQIDSTTSYRLGTTPFAVNTTIATSAAATISAVVSPNAAPSGKRIVSVTVASSVKPWLRLALYAFGTGSAPQQYSGVFIQDATLSSGRDAAALA